MSTENKRRAVCSYENMSEELAAAFAEKYPKGYSDYFQDLVKYDKPDGTSFYAVTVEMNINCGFVGTHNCAASLSMYSE